MLETTTRFQRAIRTSGQRKTVINISEAFGTTLLYSDVPVLDGSVSVDRNSDVRRSATVVLGGTELVELLTSTDSHPFGMEVQIKHGVVYQDGSEEIVQVGVFTIDDIQWEESDGGFPTLQLSDRSQWIHRDPMHVAKDYSGFWAKDVLQSVVLSVTPDIEVVISGDLGDIRLPGGSTFDSSRWEIVKACATAMGAEAYFDRFGVLQVEPIKDPTAVGTATVWEFNVGEGFEEIRGEIGQQRYISRPEGILISAKRSVSREQTFNAVAVYGAAPNGTTPQPYALVFDNDPDSPTYYFGEFGKSTKRIDNPILTNSNQCAEAAVAELRNVLGYSRGISFSAIGNPALDEGDYVLFTFLSGAQETHLLDSFSLPLAGGDFSGETRTQPARQTTSIGIKRGIALVEKRPTPPGKPKALAITNNSILLEWAVSTAGSNPLLRYEVVFNDRVMATVPSPTRRVTLRNLPSGTKYALSVRAVDYAGRESDPSAILQVKTTGPTSAPQNPVKYTKEYRAMWANSYEGDGDIINSYGSKLYQGYKHDGKGNLVGLCGFDAAEIQQDLDGAFILGCYLTLYFKEWEGKSGTAIIGFHDYSNSPDDWTDKRVFQDRIRSTGWPEPGKRKISLGNGVGESFKSGKFKGLALGPAPTRNSIYRGYAIGSTELEPILTVVFSREE